MATYKARRPHRHARRARAVAIPLPARPAHRLPSERSNQLVMLALYLALALGAAFFLGLMYIVITS